MLLEYLHQKTLNEKCLNNEGLHFFVLVFNSKENAYRRKNKSQTDTAPAPEDQKLTLSPGNTLKFQGKEKKPLAGILPQHPAVASTPKGHVSAEDGLWQEIPTGMGLPKWH